jgi:hypothetical protein
MFVRVVNWLAGAEILKRRSTPLFFYLFSYEFFLKGGDGG